MIFQKISYFLLHSSFLSIYLHKSMHKKWTFPLRISLVNMNISAKKLRIYSQLLNKSLRKTSFFVYWILLVLLLSLASFSSKVFLASFSYTLHQSTPDTDKYPVSSSEISFWQQQSIILLSRCLVLKI